VYIIMDLALLIGWLRFLASQLN